MEAPHCFKLLLFLFLLYSLHVITMSDTLTSTMLCHHNERSALLQFKQSLFASSISSAYLKAALWKARGNSSRDCCSWDGVECDDATGHVIGLDLTSSLIHATLQSNSTLFSLVHLQNLNLAENNFMNSSIPPEISHLTSLSSINFSLSSFSGQVPLELSGMSKLTSLDLSHNYLYGDFPVAIFNLPGLLVLNVSGNHNLSGYLPEFNKTSPFRELDVSFSDFSGIIPASVGNLQSVSRLRLRNCYFSGSIPASIGNLTQITYLSIASNMFNDSGDLSWFQKLTKLSLLNLYDTNLYRDILPSLANLTELAGLVLSNNPFHKPRNLYWLEKLTKLILLDLNDNSLFGEIPPFIANLTQLTFLKLQSNYFVGEIPPFFANLSQLTLLDLGSNYFVGEIPLWLMNMTQVSRLINITAIEQNLVAVQSKSLRYIDISNNMLEGSLPVPPPNTIFYSVCNNRLKGDIPPKICGVKSLKVLDVSKNSMSGPIPQCLAYSLEALVLQDNNFSGTIPQIYPQECELKVMDLSQNQLTGVVPKSLSNCKMLQILDLSNNQMKQTFPTWLGSIPRLQVLLLHSNMFHGEVGSPRILSEFPMLCIIDLSHNSFTGALPVNYIKIWSAMKVFRTDKDPYITTNVNFEKYMGAQTVIYSVPYHISMILTNKGVKMEYNKISNIFTAIDLSSNNFIGQIPESIGSLEALQLLDLSNNDLTGPIPPSLGNLTQLESLDLSHNKLSGVIPQQLASQLNFLAFFNVSHNLLSGHIPQGPQFKTFDNNSYMENLGLCGFPLLKNCGTVVLPPDENEDNSGEDKFPSGFDWLFILVGVKSGLVVGFVIGNILTARHPWLICGSVRKFIRTQKKPRMRKRQNI